MVCTVCNGDVGEPAVVEFPDTGTTVEVTLCAGCRQSFAAADVCSVTANESSKAL